MRVSTLVFLVAFALPTGLTAKPTQISANDVNAESSSGRGKAGKNLELADRVFSSICASQIKYPDWVMKQAILETGWFRSSFLMQKNNLFGFKNRAYLKFQDVEESIRYYKDWQDKKMPPDTSNYLAFLEKIKYGKVGYTRHLTAIRWDKTCPEGSEVQPETAT